MPGGHELGRLLLISGTVMAVVGLLMMYGDRVPGLFRLPGDIVVEKKNFRFYFPITTSIIVSIILSLIFWFIGRK